MWRVNSLGKKKKNQNLDSGKDWRQVEKREAEDETVGWHHWLNGHELEQTPRDCEGQGSLVCCSPWGGEVRHDLATEQQIRSQEGALCVSGTALSPSHCPRHGPSPRRPSLLCVITLPSLPLKWLLRSWEQNLTYSVSNFLQSWEIFLFPLLVIINLCIIIYWFLLLWSLFHIWSNVSHPESLWS